MTYSYERVIGYIDDIIEGDGTREMGKFIDCPICHHPLQVIVDRPSKFLHIQCVYGDSHFHWDGHYDMLPSWMSQYNKIIHDRSPCRHVDNGERVI